LVHLAGQATDERGLMYFNGERWIEDGTPCYGQNGCALAWDGARVVVFSMISRTHYQRAGVTLPCPPEVSGTSQGWLDVFAGAAPDGSEDRLLWTDLGRNVRIAGQALTLPVTRGAVT